MAATAPSARVPADKTDRDSPSKGAKMIERPPNESGATQGSPMDLEAEVQRMNELLGSTTRIQFVINRSTNDVYIEVVDKESKQVLRTIPPSELTTMAGKLSEGGLLVDNKS